MALLGTLYDTPADRLSAFVEERLQPEGDWKEEVKDAWQRVERFFREQCFRDELVLDQEVRVLKVVKVSTCGLNLEFEAQPCCLETMEPGGGGGQVISGLPLFNPDLL